MIVAISGATGSGKSTLAASVCEKLEALSPALLRQDAFFRDFHEVPEEKRANVITSNHPIAVLWDALVDHLEALLRGEAIQLPVAGSRSWGRKQDPWTLGPTSVVIIEGHLLYTEPRILRLADLKVFVDTNVHERVVRRLLRDTESGKTSLEGATNWYRRDVIPNVTRHSEKMRVLADLVIPYDEHNEVGAQAVADWVSAKHSGR